MVVASTPILSQRSSECLERLPFRLNLLIKYLNIKFDACSVDQTKYKHAAAGGDTPSQTQCSGFKRGPHMYVVQCTFTAKLKSTYL